MIKLEWFIFQIAKQQQIASNTDPNKLLSSSKTLFEGDILVRQTSEGSQLSAVFQGRLWPDAKIPYQISNDYSIFTILRHFQLPLNIVVILFRPRREDDHFKCDECISRENVCPIQPSIN